jgi:hypothetical protein
MLLRIHCPGKGFPRAGGPPGGKQDDRFGVSVFFGLNIPCVSSCKIIMFRPVSLRPMPIIDGSMIYQWWFSLG